MRFFRTLQPSPAMIVAGVALGLALVGTAIAGQVNLNNGKIKPKSIGGGKLKNDTITGAKIKESTLGEVPSAASASTATSAATAAVATVGSPIAYARVAANGDVLEANSRNITDANVSLDPTSIYCFSGLTFSFSGLQATIDAATADAGNEIAQAAIGSPNACTVAGTQAEVGTYAAGSGAEANGFFVVFY